MKMMRPALSSFVWIVLLVTVIATVLALDFIRRKYHLLEGHSSAWARGTGEYDVKAIARGLRFLADGDPPAFRKIPNGVILETSDSVITNQKGFLNLLEFYTNSSSAKYVPGVGLVDIWGNTMHFVLNSNVTSRGGQALYQISVWSNGPNGLDENMKGDDILFQSDQFIVESSAAPILPGREGIGP